MQRLDAFICLQYMYLCIVYGHSDCRDCHRIEIRHEIPYTALRCNCEHVSGICVRMIHFSAPIVDPDILADSG